MKGIFKLIPAALAVFALASCSTDELEAGKTQEQNVAAKGDLRLSFDQFDNESTTRALRDNDFGSLTFEEGDQVNVYSEDLYKTDWYTFKTDAFYYDSEGEKMVDNPKFGVMPGKAVQKAYIDRATRTTRVDVEIPSVITYDANSEVKVGDKNMYACNLPAFGYASLNAGGYVEVKQLRYMTAILKIDLEKVVSNASWLRIINYGRNATPTGMFGFQHGNDVSDIDVTAKPMSGIFTAELFADPDKRKDVHLQALDETLAGSWKPYINVDLRTAPSNTTCIYLPIVAGLDGDLDNIRVEYSKELEDDPEAIAAANWNPLPGMAFPSILFKQHSRYSGKHAFEFADMNPYLISTILEQYVKTKDNIDIEITNSFTIDKSDPKVDNVIYLPNFEKEDMVVNITLGEDFDAWRNIGGSGGPLTIKDADPDDPFTGKVILNVGEEATAAGGATTVQDVNITVNLSEATAVLAGNFAEIGNGKKLALTAGNFVYGDGTTATTGVNGTNMTLNATIGDDVKSIVIADKAEMVVAGDLDLSSGTNNTEEVIVNGKLDLKGNHLFGGEKTATITVGETGDLFGSIVALAGGEGYDYDNYATITVDGKMKGDITAGLNCYWTNINVGGYVDGSISAADAVKGSVKITTTPAAATDKVVTGNVVLKGDIEIALGAEGEAIAGTLTMLGASKTIKLVQGLVNAIYVDVKNAGTWEDRFVNLKLDDANEGVVAIKSLKVNTGEKNDVRYTKSVWDGNMITNSAYKATYTKYENQLADEEDFLKAPYNGKTDNAIFTASQLASMGAGLADLRLLNDLDMAGAGKGKGKFESIGKLMKSFKAFGHKISNLNLDNAKAVGLFAASDGSNAVVENLTIEGVTASKTADLDTGLGAVLGTDASAGTTNFKKVTVTGINFAAPGKKLSYVGGIVGSAKQPVMMSDVTVSGTIDGYERLGGLIGNAGSATTLTKCDASGIAFKQTYNSGRAMDIEYARVGGFIGTIAAGQTTYITDGVAPSTINFDHKDLMYTSNTTVGTGKFYKYQNEQNFIGFSGNKLGGLYYSQMKTSDINGAKWCAEADWTDGASPAKTHGTSPVHNYLYTWPAK